MIKHFCDDCGDTLTGMWWHGTRFGNPDLELCRRCYERRKYALSLSEAERGGIPHSDKKIDAAV